MKIVVTRTKGVSFEAVNEIGGKLRLEGSADMGGEPDALRPMEAVLAALAGCSGIDVVKILTQQKQVLESLVITVVAQRADAVPAVFTEIHVRFAFQGDVAPHKAERAVALSMEKYCSVTKMLQPTVRITSEAVVLPAAIGPTAS